MSEPHAEISRDPQAGAGGMRVADALAGLALAGPLPETLSRVRLSPTVAAAARAGIDWLAGEGAAHRPVAVSGDEAVLEIRCEFVDPAGLGPAANLIESVGGNLGPASGRRDTWVLRLPVLAERATYLMLEQGGIALAIPWHAVTRVRLLRSEGLEEDARRRGHAVLPPFATLDPKLEERPAVLVGLGLRRGLLLGDRLVWRMPAEQAGVSAAPPAPRLTSQVRTAEGDLFWVVEPDVLLREIEPSPLPAGGPVEKPAPVPEAPASAAPVAAPAAPARARPEKPRMDAPGRGMRLVELGRADVEPIGEEPATEPRPEPAAPAGGPAGLESPAAAAAARPRALVAEDSITARIFLERLLEQRGFAVEVVASARGLEAALGRGPWAIVFADVDLPDSRAAGHLVSIGNLSGGAVLPALVALVRDAADAEGARAAGVQHALRKPFEPEALDRLLVRLGMEPTS